jgi:putative transposase
MTAPRTSLTLPSDRPTTGRGGRRPGAGRKPGRWRPVGHRTRPDHARKHPVHVTITVVRKSFGTLRKERIFNSLRAILLTPGIEGFQVVHYSVQDDHLHLVVEAEDRRSFSSGMRSLEIRIARTVNRLFGRKRGKVIRDRYHRRDLVTPREVRTVLRYVLLNRSKHRQLIPGVLDVCSSAYSFDGWVEVDDPEWPRTRGDPGASPTLTVPSPAAPAPVQPWTSLLAKDWRELGLLSPYDAIRWLRPHERG